MQARIYLFMTDQVESLHIKIITRLHIKIIKYQRDLLGRLVSLQIDDAGLPVGLQLEGSRLENYQYDGLGRTIYSGNEYCKSFLSYNSLGWLIDENNIYMQSENPVNQRQFHIKRSYNINGALSSRNLCCNEY